MTDKKSDLTRIEDLGEFLHDFGENQGSSFEPLPDEGEFTSPEESFDFGATETEPKTGVEDFLSPTSFGDDDNQETSSFGDEAPAFPSEEDKKDEFQDDFSDQNKDEPTQAPFAEKFLKPLPSETIEKLTNVVDEIPFTPEIPTPVYTPEAPAAAAVAAQAPTAPPETFEDVKKFAENSHFASGSAVEGNPSFSVLLKSIRYIEDVNDILAMLKELNLLSDSEEQTRTRLMRGHLLIPRISEYAAIFLAHKLRRFDIEIQVGLSDEIHPPKHHEAPEIGVTSKGSLYQNQTHHFRFDDTKVELSQIIVAATSTLDGYQVLRYQGVASEHTMIESEIVENESSAEMPLIYQQLAQKLKAHALKAHANAVVGLNYQLTPLPAEFGHTGQKYRLSCTGNLVWVNKL